jgi:hypothetical protein
MKRKSTPGSPPHDTEVKSVLLVCLFFFSFFFYYSYCIACLCDSNTVIAYPSILIYRISAEESLLLQRSEEKV